MRARDDEGIEDDMEMRYQHQGTQEDTRRVSRRRATAASSIMASPETMETIAHRGACFDAPENSLEAFEIAIEQGADRIELDVHVTRDAHAVVCHDPTTERVGSHRAEIEFATFEELRHVRLANGEPIPSLDEACQLMRGRVAADVELKATTDAGARQTLEILAKHDLLDTALITSFDPQILRRLRIMGYKGRTGLLVGSRSLNVRQRAYEAWPMRGIETARATDLVIHHLLAHRTLRNGLERRGVGLLLWTSVEDEQRPEELRRAMYEKLAATDTIGVIVGRIQEARAVFDAA